MPAGSSHFRLPASLARKTVASLIDGDDAHFAAVDAAVSAQAGAVSDRLDTLRAIPARAGREAVERDAEIRTLTARLALLRRRGAQAQYLGALWRQGIEPGQVLVKCLQIPLGEGQAGHRQQ